MARPSLDASITLVMPVVFRSAIFFHTSAAPAKSPLKTVAKSSDKLPHWSMMVLIVSAKCYVDGAIHQPSTSWSIAGPIIQRERITVSYDDQKGTECGGWTAWVHDSDTDLQWHVSPIVKAMRAYVASRFGDEIDLE